MLGINLYKLPLTVRGYECGLRQKKKNLQGRRRRVGKVYHSPQTEKTTIFVTGSIDLMKKMVKLFSAGWTMEFRVFIESRCILSKTDMKVI